MAGMEASIQPRARHESACVRQTAAAGTCGGADCRDTRQRAEANGRAGSGRHEHGVPTVPIMLAGHDCMWIVSCLGVRRGTQCHSTIVRVRIGSCRAGPFRFFGLLQISVI